MKRISFENLTGLSPREGGLSEEEASSQLSRYGKNQIVEVSGNPWIELALDTLKDPMIWFLIVIGTVFLLTGDNGEAVTLFIAILPLLFMDAFLHWRTRASTSNLKGRLASRVTALRDGREIQIDSADLVPGDLILVSSDLFLPADGIFQEVSDLQMDESALTGEAFPAPKKASGADPFQLSDKGEVAVDPAWLGFAGTRALAGAGKMRIVRTGQQTAYGEIVQSVAKMPHERTPLQKAISRIVRQLSIAAVFLCLLLAAVRIYQGHGWLDALLSGATLALAALPEEFPVVFTFFLGVGVYRLAKQQALVRRAVSVENIGRVTQICTDKTGTLTIGVLQLTHLDPRDLFPELEVISAALAASSPGGTDPVNVAIREAAKIRQLPDPERRRTFPFTETRKQETTIVRESDGQFFAYRKGSPETVLSGSSLTEAERNEWKERTANWAREGHKVLACSKKILSEAEASRDEEPLQGFDFCGLLAFEDPPRPEVKEAIAYCRQNNIRVLMLTGDHQDTAVAIAKDIGLGGPSPAALSAEENPEKFDERWLADNPDFLGRLDIVARSTPLQKLQIVNALKKSGELVAVTGDGVNDVPALKAANIGIAMGERGTRSAKEVASIILADDNFRTIVGAIREGRQLFSNLRMSFKYLLLIHIPFILTAAIIPLLGYPLLYLPVHIVWLELIIHPSALFAFQQRASAKESREHREDSFFGRYELVSIALLGGALTAILSFSYVSGLSEGAGEGRARAIAMLILTLWSAGVVAVLSKLRTVASILVVLGTAISTLLLIQLPTGGGALKLAPLHFSDWMLGIGWISLLLVLNLAGNFLGSRIGARKS